LRRITAKPKTAAKPRRVTPPPKTGSSRPVFKKVLCPIDFDRISIPALKLAYSVARQNGSAVHVLYVIPEELRAELEQLTHKNLLSVTRKWFGGRVRNEILVRTGRPVDAVLAAADELDVDLIVMATHGRTGAKRARLGSVTEEVVRRATRPVLTIHPG
jgi:nucleotide-binding universal stress UspA family protein